MSEAWMHISFLPGVPELQKYLPPAAVKPRATYDPNCAECSGSGWKNAMGYSCLDRQKTRGVIRCDCNTRPHTTRKPDSAPDAAFIAAKVAELDAILKMPTKTPAKFAYGRKPAPSAAPTIPMVQFTADQIQQRKPVERAEIHDVEDKLTQARNGTYDPAPRP
jgi:hypothetical protein